MALLLRLTLLLTLLGVGGCSGLFFYPMSDWVQNPSRQGLDYEDIVLIHPDGQRIHGWWLPSATDEVRGTVYHLHGNAQNISTHLMNVAWLPEKGYQVLLIDYRGYGLSEGEPDLAGARKDIQLGLDWLYAADRVKPPLVVFGQSLGASLATGVLARAGNAGKGDCVILEAPFTSYQSITRDVMRKSWVLWPFSFLVAPLMPDEADPIDRIADIAPRPLLVMHSIEDGIIPFEHGKALYEAAAQPKTFQRLRGKHIRSAQAEDVRGRLQDFIREDCP
ncbi:alpha/beta hydrolase [Salicola sp. Rm-C-2C1-2]|uniref:alpha/beta hydrolase n=1 Tax=Salicola sp. Rm-C-2C1-2 TaxID=3141321 RepID=UPI0032E3694A